MSDGGRGTGFSESGQRRLHVVAPAGEDAKAGDVDEQPLARLAHVCGDVVQSLDPLGQLFGDGHVRSGARASCPP